MDSAHIPKEGQILLGPLFNEPMLVETVRPGGAAVWTVGLVGSRTHQFRRVHAAMLLQSGGRAHALRSLLKSEVERSPDFLRLANALSALYPKDSEEKRLLDAMLLAVPR